MNLIFKTVGGLSIFISAIYIVLNIKKEYRQREEIIKTIIKDIKTIKIKIELNKITVSKILDYLEKTSPLKKFYRYIYENIDDEKKIEKYIFLNFNIKNKNLNKILIDFFRNLGTLDYENQLKNIDETVILFTNLLSLFGSEREEKEKVKCSLCVLSALTFIILFI